MRFNGPQEETNVPIEVNCILINGYSHIQFSETCCTRNTLFIKYDFVVNTLQIQTERYGVQPQSCTADSSVSSVITQRTELYIEHVINSSNEHMQPTHHLWSQRTKQPVCILNCSNYRVMPEYDNNYRLANKTRRMSMAHVYI